MLEVLLWVYSASRFRSPLNGRRSTINGAVLINFLAFCKSGFEPEALSPAERVSLGSLGNRSWIFAAA